MLYVSFDRSPSVVELGYLYCTDIMRVSSCCDGRGWEKMTWLSIRSSRSVSKEEQAGLV